MQKKHLSKRFLSLMLVSTLTLTSFVIPTTDTTAAVSADNPTEFSIECNPIGTVDEDGKPIYGGDPAVLVEGDTVYLYVGHDTSTNDSYIMPEYLCYSTQNFKDWKYYGSVFKMTDVNWTKDNTSAWAGQTVKYGSKYYMYYCSWNKNDSGKHSIGVAVADKPTGPFVDKGEPVVNGSFTTYQTGDDTGSDWNDIDPTVWIEEDENGVEHRYLAWGNTKFFTCELNEDMVSVKDINEDNKVTFGKSTDSADVIERNVEGLAYTEAPWLYRRKDADGKPYGKYYLFYAYGWREQLAYATMDNIMEGKITLGTVLTPPSSTANTHHMAVFDFKGKTYIIDHSGSMPGGNGYRRSPVIDILEFNEDGSIDPITETTAPEAIFGTGLKHKIYTSDKKLITHVPFVNSTNDAAYPYKNVDVGTLTSDDPLDSTWVFTKSFFDPSYEDYVCIQSENKHGLYLTPDKNSVKLSQNSDFKKPADTAKTQTFKKVAGLNDAAGVSFESVDKPGAYITVMGTALYLTDGSHKAAATFYIDNPPAEIKTDSSFNNENSLKKIIATDGKTNYDVTKGGNTYSVTVPYTVKELSVTFEVEDSDGLIFLDGSPLDGSTVDLSTSKSSTDISICAASYVETQHLTFEIKKDYKGFKFGKKPVHTFDFENKADGATAVTTEIPPKRSSARLTYTTGVNGGKAILLDGSYGLQLCQTSDLGDTYSISYWMKPEELKSNVDPTFCAGTFNPQYWVNLTYGRGIWARKEAGDKWYDDSGSPNYKAKEWQHVVLIVKDDKAELYINGELSNKGSIAKGIMTNSGAIAYFGVNGWDSCFNGAVDEIMMFDYALDVNAVEALAEKVTSLKDVLNPKEEDDSNKNNNNNNNNNPPAPTVAAPIIKAAENTAKGITVSWSKVNDAAGYEIYRDNKKIATIANNGTVSYNDASAKSKNGTTYTYKVVAYKTANGKTATAASKTVTICRLTTPGSLKLKAKSKKAITVKYKKNAKAGGYEIQYAAKKDFTGAKTKKITKAKTVKCVISGLKKKTKYFVRIRAYKKAGGTISYSAWSSAKKVTTKKK